MKEMKIGTCDCCGKENIPLIRKYFRYPIQCECCLPRHFEMVRHCEDCDPEEPEKTQITLKTEDLKNPFVFAFKIMKEEMQKTRNIKGEIYYVWQSSLAVMLHYAAPKMTIERANEIAMEWLDRLFEIK